MPAAPTMLHMARCCPRSEAPLQRPPVRVDEAENGGIGVTAVEDDESEHTGLDPKVIRGSRHLSQHTHHPFAFAADPGDWTPGRCVLESLDELGPPVGA